MLARADRVPPADQREWTRFLGLIERHRLNPQASLNCGVLANLIGIAAFGDDADLVTLAELGCLFGVDRVAAVQHRAARFIEPDATFPITTAAVRRMMGASAHPDADTVLDAAVALLLEGVDLDLSLPVIRTEAELLGVIDHGSVLEWRHHFAMIAASPWSPYPGHLAKLAQQAARPEVAAVVDRFTDVCRDHHKEREREQVAGEVRRLVAVSGATQRRFAHWVGTSPSRLSTYISGTVTPSASLMLRMERTSRLLQERELPPAPQTTSEQSWGAARADHDGVTASRPDRPSAPRGRSDGPDHTFRRSDHKPTHRERETARSSSLGGRSVGRKGRETAIPSEPIGGSLGRDGLAFAQGAACQSSVSTMACRSAAALVATGFASLRAARSMSANRSAARARSSAWSAEVPRSDSHADRTPAT